MACRRCSSYVELLPKYTTSITRAQALNGRQSQTATTAMRPAVLPQPRRRFHRSARVFASEPSEPPNTKSDMSALQNIIKNNMGDSRLARPYRIYGTTQDIYATCSAQAAYTISEADRKAGVKTTDDGEEIGKSKGSVWHNDFGLLPTFSTWAQVTMLHMYLLVVRFRCLDDEDLKRWQANLVDHFFHEAEDRMLLNHALTSRSIRQKYLQDLFLKWRGMILAFDEGLALSAPGVATAGATTNPRAAGNGDAVLAGAVWRNLLKGREDVDARVVAAIVSWMRQTLKRLDGVPDEALLGEGPRVFALAATLVGRDFRAMDRELVPELKELEDMMVVEPQPMEKGPVDG